MGWFRIGRALTETEKTSVAFQRFGADTVAYALFFSGISVIGVSTLFLAIWMRDQHSRSQSGSTGE